MSSFAVRQALEAAWPLLTPTLPFVPTINSLPVGDTTVSIWGTFIYDASLRPHQTMGSRPWIEEQGVATIGLLGLSGVGDDAIAQMADDVVKAWEMWINATQDIWIDSVDPPRPPDNEAVGDVYRLVVGLNYRYQTRGGS